MNEKATYVDRLIASARDARTLLCVGIDPVPERFPRELRDADEFVTIARTPELVNALLDSVERDGIRPAAIKPNLGYFSRYDRPRALELTTDQRYVGSIALARSLNLIARRLPSVPVILDSKRGDIARSSDNYAVEAFDRWNADAVTVSPWMGDDSVRPFTARATARGAGVYVLARTSNPGAARFQDLSTADGPVYRQILGAILRWATEYPGTGAVVGATAETELRDALSLLSSDPIPLLIPGVGGQGGTPHTVVHAIESTGFPPELVRVNASRAVLSPWISDHRYADTDWREAIRSAFSELHGALRWKNA